MKRFLIAVTILALMIVPVLDGGEYRHTGLRAVMPSGTTPWPVMEGALFLDTDASANGTVVCYADGAWRTVVELP